MADLTKTLIALLRAGMVDEVRLEVVLKPTPPAPPSPTHIPTVTMIIGPPEDEV